MHFLLYMPLTYGGKKWKTLSRETLLLMVLSYIQLSDIASTKETKHSWKVHDIRYHIGISSHALERNPWCLIFRMSLLSAAIWGQKKIKGTKSWMCTVVNWIDVLDMNSATQNCTCIVRYDGDVVCGEIRDRHHCHFLLVCLGLFCLGFF